MANRWLIAATVLAAAAVGVGAASLFGGRAPPEFRSGTALDEPRPLADFSLVDQHGREFTRDRLRDRWSLVFAGFTHCPDICPTTLALLAELQARLPRDRWQFLFLSVDPDRDTPAALAQYLGHFSPDLVGATGTRAQVAEFAGQLGLAHVRNPGAGGDYTVDHSAALVLIDPDARIAGYFQPPHDPGRLAADLMPLADGAG